ncbi:MAG: hypothetical protein HMLKMBBP_03398 [Planctomycetes bacterium]|nr:hypothetical protein [Planctomycetota bacterium]
MRRALALSWIAAFALLGAPGAAQAEDAPQDAQTSRLERLDLRDVPLGQACRLLSDCTGLNLAPSAEASQRRVTLFLTGVAVADAVDVLCRTHQLWHETDRRTGIVRIHTSAEYRLDASVLQEERTEHFTVRYPSAWDVSDAIRNLFGSRVSAGARRSSDLVTDELEERFDRFDVVDERTEGLGFAGTGTGAGVSGSGAAGTTSGEVTGTSRRDRTSRSQQSREDPVEAAVQSGPATAQPDLERLRGLIAGTGSDDARSRAVADAAARTLELPIHVTVANRQNQLIVRTADARAMEQIRALVRALDVPTPVVLLEVRVYDVKLDDGFESFFEYQWANGEYAGGFSAGDIAARAGGALGPGGTGLRAGDLSFQYVDANFAARLQVLEREGKVRTLATPLLLTANNEVSRLFIGREVPLNRTFSGGQLVTDDGATTTTPGTTQIEFRRVGTTLLITPNVHEDRTVTLRILQEASDVDTTATVLVPNGSGFSQQTLPVVRSQTVSGTIVARSERAVAFGGLIATTSRKEREQVPVLGDVPLLGTLFSRETVADQRSETVIVVRPWVMRDAAEAETLTGRALGGLGSEVRIPLPETDAGVRGAAAPLPAPSGR